MKKLKKLTRKQKELLSSKGFKTEDYLMERHDEWGYRFYNVHTNQLMDLMEEYHG